MARGISSLETLFAGFLLSSCLFLIISLFPTSQLGLRQSAQLLTAHQVTQSLLEARRAVPWTAIAGETGELVNDNIRFAYQVTVEDGTPGVRRVAVRVTWTDGSRNRLLERETRISRWNQR